MPTLIRRSRLVMRLTAFSAHSRLSFLAEAVADGTGWFSSEQAGQGR
jgi:hypothetical protein